MVREGRASSTIHALLDNNGRPVRLALTPGVAHDNRLAKKLLSGLKPGSMLLADFSPLMNQRVRAEVARVTQPARKWIKPPGSRLFPITSC